eukprot:jgi/Tetstr1/458946/TSEL_004417.t1
MLASVKQAAARLERFLAARHEGDPLDRPVLDFLAGAIADAADEAQSRRRCGGGDGGQPASQQLASLALSAAAPEWKPSAAAAEWRPAQLVPQMAEGAAPGAGQETEGDAEGNEEGCDEWPEEDYWEEEYGHEAWGAMDENQALEVLVYHFPHYSLDVLRDILANNGGSLAMTLGILSQFEAELAGQAGLPEPEEARAEPEAPPPPIDDESLFPALGGPAGGAGATGPALVWGRADDFAGALRKRAPAPPPGAASARAARPGPGRPAPASWAHAAPSGWRGGQPVQWVDTGESVSAMYADTRAEARDYARVRNVYFEQATKAYLAGNKALAKELSAKGRGAAESMRAAHEAASHQIYQARNRNVGNKDMIDLHGLHAKEGVQFLRSEIASLRAQGQARVSVLVGTGHHTRTNKSTLPLAVEEFLKEKMIPFSVAQPGLLELQLLR